MHYRANDLWKSVTSVSSAGSKKGRGKRRGAARGKDLNLGQTIGDGKLQVSWPGLNADVMERGAEGQKSYGLKPIKIIGVDEDREKKLVEIRNRMDKFKSITVFPIERGFTSSSMKGKSIGEPVSYDDVDFKEFDTRIIDFRTMIQMKSILGSRKTVNAFVVTGNGKGILGYGKGSAPLTTGALRNAKTKASQNLLRFKLYEDRTLFHNFYEEYYLTKVYAEKKPKGYGVVANRVIKKICQLIGIKDIYVKVEGSPNAKNVTKAFLSGLLNQMKYEDISKETNLHVVEFKPEMNNFPLVLSKAENPILKNDLQSADKNQRSINTFLFDNRFRAEKKKNLPFYYHYDSYKKYCKLRDKDLALKKARMNRLRQLPEEILMSDRYPKFKVAKPADDAEAS